MGCIYIGGIRVSMVKDDWGYTDADGMSIEGAHPAVKQST
jgi:hypothetical protein